MGKAKFTFEYEINASRKMLYPYLSSASGLAQWFADDVTVNEDKVFNFIYDDTDHYAKLTIQRLNNLVRFDFLKENGLSETDIDADYIEFKLETNELTQTTFLKITEFADFESPEEQEEVWTHMLNTLKEIVGG
ncbi:MAG: START-like domain-containing protein [Cyclobacteriaceae bacterium]